MLGLEAPCGNTRGPQKLPKLPWPIPLLTIAKVRILLGNNQNRQEVGGIRDKKSTAVTVTLKRRPGALGLSVCTPEFPLPATPTNVFSRHVIVFSA